MWAVLAGSLAGGVIMGAIEGVLSRWFSLLLLFPAMIALAAGGLASWMVHRQQLRAPALALVLGIAGGVAGYITVHVVEYARFRSVSVEAIRTQHASETESSAGSTLDLMLDQETGHAGFLGYLLVSARQGVTLKRVGVGDPGLALKGAGAWGVWAFELLLAAGAAGLLTSKAARQPFCEACKVWYGPLRFVAMGGDASAKARKQFIAALERADVGAAAAAFQGARGRHANFGLLSSTCPQCGADTYCALKRVGPRNRVQQPVLASWLMTRDELARLSLAVTRPHA